jgi:hypothetical protein
MIILENCIAKHFCVWVQVLHYLLHFRCEVYNRVHWHSLVNLVINLWVS